MAKGSEPGRNLGSPNSYFFMYSFKQVRIGGPVISVPLIFPREDNWGKKKKVGELKLKETFS